MSATRAIFYFDLASPHGWLMAERVNGLFQLPPVWQPVVLDPPAAPDRDDVARRAAEYGLLPVRWPPVWPPDTRLAMQAATFAKQTGRVVAFSLAAFRQAFAAGRDLGDLDNVLLAAAACELHPRAVTAGVEMRAVREELERAGEEARALGVGASPALVVGGDVFEGDDGVEEAAARVR